MRSPAPKQIAPRVKALQASRELLLDGTQPVAFDWARDLLLLEENLPYHPNAMTLIVFGEAGELHRDTYYSIGGGFVVEVAKCGTGQAAVADVAHECQRGFDVSGIGRGDVA